MIHTSTRRAVGRQPKHLSLRKSRFDSDAVSGRTVRCVAMLSTSRPTGVVFSPFKHHHTTLARGRHLISHTSLNEYKTHSSGACPPKHRCRHDPCVASLPSDTHSFRLRHARPLLSETVRVCVCASVVRRPQRLVAGHGASGVRPDAPDQHLCARTCVCVFGCGSL